MLHYFCICFFVSSHVFNSLETLSLEGIPLGDQISRCFCINISKATTGLFRDHQNAFVRKRGRDSETPVSITRTWPRARLTVLWTAGRDIRLAWSI